MQHIMDDINKMEIVLNDIQKEEMNNIMTERECK